MAMRAGEKRQKAGALPGDIGRNIAKSTAPYTVMKAEESVEVNLYGEVVESVPIDWWTGEKVDGLFIELAEFLNLLDTLKDAKDITFRINSIGGDVEAGIAIYNRIRELSGHTTTIVDGIAASAASIIAQAGDTRQVSVGAQTMIHGASAGLVGYYNVSALKRMEDMLTTINKSVAGIYAERSGQTQEHILSMMAKEKWMTPEEALEEGFADEIVGKEEPVIDQIENSSRFLVNGIPHNLYNMRFPETMRMRGMLSGTGATPAMRLDVAKDEISNGQEPSDINKTPSTTQEGRRMMDLKELQTNHPELVDQIREEATQTARQETENAVKAALEADRKRMMEIDSIAQMVGNPALVNKAKYEEPMTAEALAFKAMQAQQAAGSAYLAGREEETKNEVSVAPNGGIEDTIAHDEEELNNLINSIKKEDK